MTIRAVETRDVRFSLPGGAGSDAVHGDPVYAYATTILRTETALSGTGFVLTLGAGNDLVCRAIEGLAHGLIGRDIDELMAGFGAVTRQIADDPAWRWLGPHKGVVHLALSSLANACFDLWAKHRGLPLWALLLELEPEDIVALCDFSYCEDTLGVDQALALLREEWPAREARQTSLGGRFPGYDTSAGWFGYSDRKVADEIRRSLDSGFQAVKLKVGSGEIERDRRRAALVREIAGDSFLVLLDVNQQWMPEKAAENARMFAEMDPFWIEEPTHPDDVVAHAALVREIAPLRVAAGEHLPNRVVFKNYLNSQALHFAQADCVRLAGVGEFLMVSLMARAQGIPIVPHVGDMGQVHQHLVAFNHIALGDPCPFLESIPHLRERFLFPAQVDGGYYQLPQAPGASTDFR